MHIYASTIRNYTRITRKIAFQLLFCLLCKKKHKFISLLYFNSLDITKYDSSVKR